PDAGVALRLWNRKMRRVIASRNCRHLTAHIAASSERHVVPKVLSLLRLLRPLAAEHHELVRHDLRGVAVIAVAVLPFPRPQLPLDVALRPLPQILRRDLGEPAEHHYVMKLRALLPLTRLTVLPRFVRRDPNIRHRTAVRHGAGFWVRTKPTDKLHLVQAPHVRTFRSNSSTCTASA